jgi:ATP-binding cassette, subfamily C, bacterial
VPTLRFIRRLLREQPLRFTAVVVSAALAGVLDGVWIAALVPLLDVLGGKGSGGSVGALVGGALGVLGVEVSLPAILGFVLFFVLAQQVATVAQAKIAWGSIYRFESDLRNRLYSAVFDAGWPFFVGEKTGDLVNALTVESTRASTAYNYLNQLLSIGLVVAAYIALAFLLSVPMTLIVVVAGATFAFGLRKKVARGTRFGLDVTDLNQDVQGAALENISGAKLVKGVGAERDSVARFGDTVRRLANKQYRMQMNQAWVKLIYDSLSAVVVVVGIWLATTQFRMALAELMVFLVIFARIAPRISNLALLQHNLLAFLPALDRIDDLTAEASSMREESGETRLAPFRDAIELRGVTFGYDPDEPVVRDLDLTIQAGGTTAVVGPSGAGKTTIIDLVMRLILPQAGTAEVDGVPMAELDVADWRRRIGYVAQDAVLFHASVRDNIAFGAPDATEDEIREAARLAFADEFISEMQDGYDTVVGDRGMRLSGGQRQRIALARAIVRRPEILILDEATSALDAESETKIQAAVAALAQRLTVLIVTHRLATVRDAGTIYVLDDGRLVERGTFDELVAAGGRFEELRRLQALDGEPAPGRRE